MLSSLAYDGLMGLAGRSGASLPAGALGVWFMDQYDSTTKTVPNSVSAVTLSANIIRLSRRAFSKSDWWIQGGSGTIADDATADPSGVTEASTCNFSGNWYLAPNVSTNLPAGTYTVGAWVKRNTGTDQLFCFTGDNTATRSSQFTATAAWQRFSYTFTLASPTVTNRVKLCSIDGSTAANLAFCDFTIYDGSSDLGAEALAGHLRVGSSANDPAPSSSSGELNLASSAYGSIQFPTATTVSQWTTMAALRKTAAGSSHQAWLSRAQSYTQFSAMVEQAGIPVISTTDNQFNDVPGGSGAMQFAGMWSLLNDGWHVLTHRYDGTNATLWLDDTRLFIDKGTYASFSLRDLFFNIVNSTALYGGLGYSSCAFWNSALSDADVRTGFKSLKARAVRSEIIIDGDTTNRNYVAEGDSITGAASTCYPYKFGPNSSPSILGSNFAVSGSTLANLLARASAVDGVLPPALNGRKFILSVLIGANDLAGYTGATDAAAAANYLTALASYCDARRLAGYKVVVCTILPISGATAHNARRAIVNSAITSGWLGVHCDAIADFAADPTMGTDTSFTDNPSKWTDGTHPNAAGHTILETIIRPVINGL